MLGSLFNILIKQPLAEVLLFIYNLVPDYGVSIILLTFLIRVVLFPLNQKALRSQQEMTKLQPQLKKIQNKYQQDKAKQAEALMGFYKEHKVNPFAGIWPMLIQFPILIALFIIFKETSGSFLGLIELSEKSLILALLAGGVQYWQVKSMSQKIGFMQYFMPLLTVIFGYSFPAALPLYWIANTLFMIVQQKYIHAKDNKNHPPNIK